MSGHPDVSFPFIWSFISIARSAVLDAKTCRSWLAFAPFRPSGSHILRLDGSVPASRQKFSLRYFSIFRSRISYCCLPTFIFWAITWISSSPPSTSLQISSWLQHWSQSYPLSFPVASPSLPAHIYSTESFSLLPPSTAEFIYPSSTLRFLCPLIEVPVLFLGAFW